jgi:hypothetical protein
MYSNISYIFNNSIPGILFQVLPLSFPLASSDRYILSYLFGVMAMLGKSKLLHVGVLEESPGKYHFNYQSII